MSDQTWWFVARASGFVAFGLLGLSVVGGMLLSTRRFGRPPPADWMLDWHRFVGGLSVVFTAAHLATLWADSYIEFDVLELLVPFVSDWRPVAVAWGVLALYLLVAIEVTSLLRRRLPRPLWRWIHQLSVPAFVLATVHLLSAGEDASDPVTLLVVGALAGTTLLLLGYRIVPSARESAPPDDRPAASAEAVETERRS